MALEMAGRKRWSGGRSSGRSVVIDVSYWFVAVLVTDSRELGDLKTGIDGRFCRYLRKCSPRFCWFFFALAAISGSITIASSERESRALTFDRFHRLHFRRDRGAKHGRYASIHGVSYHIAPHDGIMLLGGRYVLVAGAGRHYRQRSASANLGTDPGAPHVV